MTFGARTWILFGVSRIKTKHFRWPFWRILFIYHSTVGLKRRLTVWFAVVCCCTRIAKQTTPKRIKKKKRAKIPSARHTEQCPSRVSIYLCSLFLCVCVRVGSEDFVIYWLAGEICFISASEECLSHITEHTSRRWANHMVIAWEAFSFSSLFLRVFQFENPTLRLLQAFHRVFFFPLAFDETQNQWQVTPPALGCIWN